MQPKEEVEVEDEVEDEEEEEEEEEEGEDRLKDSRRAIHEPSRIERERKYIEGQAQQQNQDASGVAVSEAGPVEEGVLLARVHVPELYVSKCLQFPKDQLVWDVKQQCLASLPKVGTAAPANQPELAWKTISLPCGYNLNVIIVTNKQ
ncbi:hypothetical protein M0804_012641 [Polistes exclamans]|nr:hypothetical protein M0804_012641 [Polistes exclamans]